MIRVRLQSEPRPLRRAAFAAGVVAALAVLAIGALRVLDEFYPLGRWWRDAAAPPVAAARAEMPPAAPDRAPAPPPEPARSSPAAAEASPAPAPTARDDDVPYGSPACLQVASLPRQLPGGVQLTSLSGSADGAYVVEGLVPATGVAELLATLDGMPTRARLSYWRSGKIRRESYYKFLFDGQVSSEPRTPLAAVDDRGATALTDEVSSRARERGLWGLHLDQPVEVDLGAGRSHRRFKYWANGPLAQISTFVTDLESLGASLAVDELLVVPTPGDRTAAVPEARLCAAMHVVVRQPTAAAATP